MSDVSWSSIEQATVVLREIARESRVILILGEYPPRDSMVGFPPSGAYTACTRRPPRSKKYRVHSLCPSACPNVVEAILHEIAHCVLGFPVEDPRYDYSKEEYALDRRVHELEQKWAQRFPEEIRDVILRDVANVLRVYDEEGH